MLDLRFLESFLKVNNVDGTMTDADVRATLLRAGWADSEITAALALLNGKGQGGALQLAHSDAVAFRPDIDFNSAQLSSMLGVDVVVDPRKMHYPEGTISSVRAALVEFFSAVAVIFLSLALAAGLGIGVAFFLELGPFAQPSAHAIVDPTRP